jgi:hypothetical protein
MQIIAEDAEVIPAEVAEENHTEISETFHRKFILPFQALFFIQTPHIKYILTLPWTIDYGLFTICEIRRL